MCYSLKAVNCSQATGKKVYCASMTRRKFGWTGTITVFTIIIIIHYYSVLMETHYKRPFMTNLSIDLCILILLQNRTKMWNTYGESETNPITSTSCEKMAGTGVHQVEQSKKSCDASFEHLRIYDRFLPIKKHIPITLVRV